MLYNPISSYPQKIDDRVFFQDNDIPKMEIIEHYNKLISKGKYDEANDYINQQKNIYGLFPDYLNLIENRIYNLQDYISNEEPKDNPFIFYDKKGYGIEIFTDEDEVENLSDIKLFSPDDSEFINTDTIYVFEDENSPDNIRVFKTDTEEESFIEIEPSEINEDMIWI